MTRLAPYPEPDLTALTHSLLRGWKVLLTVALVAAASTTAMVLRWPPLWQSHLELRLTQGVDPWLAALGLDLPPSRAMALLLSSDVRTRVASELGGEPTTWGVEQVVAVPHGDAGVFLIVRDADPERAAAVAAAIGRAALALRRAQLEAALAERETLWRRQRDTDLARLAGFASDGASPPSGLNDELAADLQRARRQAAIDAVVATEGWLARVRRERERAEPPWLVVEAPAPAQGQARRPLVLAALAATLLPVLVAAAVWLWVDRPARIVPPCPG